MVKNTLFFVFSFFNTLYASGPQYDSPNTKTVIESMIQAHGGFEKWKNAKTISYDNIFFNPTAPPDQSPWWFSHEVFDQATRRTYHNWFLDGAVLASDGAKAWTKDWKQANYPAFMAYFFYYFVNLPWLTQDKNVKLSDVGKNKLPGSSTEYWTVKMEFVNHPPLGRTKSDFFVLYIDPKTYRLAGYQYNVSYGAMLDLMGFPKEVTYMGPVLRIIDQLKEVDGLLYPTRFHTMNLEGTQTFGYHIITNFSTTEKFNEKQMIQQSGSILDSSSELRK
ncbi:hypothetical protein K1X84_04780 [bacterium]|nr:hypothetical protein [bacterium]